MGKKIGIDLGTTFSAVAIFDEKTKQPVIVKNQNGNNITPSVIQFLGKGKYIVGEDAKEAFDVGEDGCVHAFKRGMGEDSVYATYDGVEYSPVDLSAILLKYLVEGAEKTLKDKVDEAVITVPAYFYHEERKATLDAAKKIGLKVRMLINEPTAAAMNYGMNHWRENALIMVYDLGGGTFDVTLLQMLRGGNIKSINTVGNHILGGKDWDKRLQEYIKEQIYNETGFDADEDIDLKNMIVGTSETIKKNLSKKAVVKQKYNVPDYGVLEVEITTEKFEEITKDLLDQTGGLCKKILVDQKLKWSDVTDILLVGGSTRMPMVSKYLKALTNHQPISHVNPDEAVALGAAIQTTMPIPTYSVISELPNKNNKKTVTVGKVATESKLSVAAMSVNDVQAHALGIIAVNEEGTAYINQNIIPSNQSIPVKSAREFNYYTTADGKNEIDIYLLQGEGAIKDCKVLNKYIVKGIRHREAGPVKVKIQYSYDRSGMVHVQARKENDNTDLPIQETAKPKDMSMFYKPIPVEKRQDKTSILFVIDTSGSMEGDGIDETRKSMIDFVNKFKGQNVDFGILAFSSAITPVLDLTDNYSLISSKINSIYDGLGGYGTDADPFPTAYQKMKHVKGNKYIIVLTDGAWWTNTDPVANSRKCQNDGNQVIGIGCGDADSAFIKSISSANAKSITTSGYSEVRKSFGSIAQTINTSSKSTKKSDNKQVFAATWAGVDE